MSRRSQPPWIALLVLVAFGFPLICSTALAKPSSAPLNPAFKAFIAAKKSSGRKPVASDSGHGKGDIPPPVNRDYIAGPSALRALDGAPASYDLRSTSGKVPPVRNQGSCGSCWAFATYGSLETCIRPTDTSDFSENHLKNNHGWDYGPCEGGHAWMSAAYLGRWGGPVWESDDPYGTSGGTSPPGLEPRAHVHEVWWLPADPTVIKNEVMAHGGVYANYLHDDAYYNSATAAYYHPTATSTNHAVCIIGWDDAYSKSNFKAGTQPKANGAWLVRNSWGTSWGLSGYFWVSYEDAKFAKSTIVQFPEIESANNYDYQYCYDPLGWVGDLGYGGSNYSMWAANLFTSTGNHIVKAIGFYVTQGGGSYSARLYKNPTSGPYTGGTLVATASGSCTYAGLHAATLSAPVSLTTGDRFSICIQFTNPSYARPAAYEFRIAGATSAATASAGQSYYSNNGTSWTDLTTYDSTANFCIKAFADAVPPPAVTAISPDTGTNTGPVSVTITGTGFRTGATTKLTRSGQTDINGSSVAVVSDTQITCSFDITGAAVGPWSVVVTNDDDQTGTLTDGFTVEYPAPTVIEIAPDSGPNTSSVEVTIGGTGFRTGATTKLTRTGQADIAGTSVVVDSATQITCSFDLTGAALGLWNVVVTNDDGRSGQLANGFEVLGEPPTITEWAVVATHSNGVGQVITPCTDGYVEPRTCRLAMLRLTFSAPLTAVAAANVSVAGVKGGDLSANVAGVTLSGDNDVLWIEFNPALPDDDTYTITLSDTITGRDTGLALSGDRDCILKVCIGDVNGSSRVTITDMYVMQSMLNRTVTSDNCRYDLNLNGLITITEMYLVQSHMNHAAP